MTTKYVCLICLIVVVALYFTTSNDAVANDESNGCMRFKPHTITDDNGRSKRVLIMQGGFCSSDDEPSAGGTADVFRRTTNYGNDRYSQYWIESYGGDLSNGILLGLHLRAAGAHVVVKKQSYCISACTVAFLGGLIREVEQGARFGVHAYSAALGAEDFARALDRAVKNERDQKLAKLIGSALQDDAYLRAHNEEVLKLIYRDALADYFMPPWLLMYSIHMLRHPPIPTYHRRVESHNSPFVRPLRFSLGPALDAVQETYRDANLAIDSEQVKAGGIAALHDIYMRVERDSMEISIAHFRRLLKEGWFNQLSGFPQSANPYISRAIDAIEIMFSSRIDFTFDIRQTVLRENGYTNFPPF